jgi:hypothetical protein
MTASSSSSISFLENLCVDVFCHLTTFLRLKDILHLCELSKKCYSLCVAPVIWQELCVKEFGKEKPDLNEPEKITTEIGLARKSVTWRDFFISMWCSEVFVWGRGSMGRLGLDCDEQPVPTPTSVAALAHKGIHFLGKTAEVGSIAISKSGNEIYLWGQCAGSRLPLRIDTAELSPIPNDIAVHVSCGHDSLFLIVMRSGLVFWCTYHQRAITAKDFINLNETFLNKYLLPKERPQFSVGGQSGWAGIITDQSRLIAWPANANPDTQCSVVEPLDESRETFKIKKAFFGHRLFMALSTEGKLYTVDVHRNDWSSTRWHLASLPDHVVIDADGGSDHYGYVTEDGRAYTWGKGNMGCLGHGNKDDIVFPKQVKFFKENNMKVVAIGAGGTYWWSGGFTLYLLDDNRLYLSGRLGKEDEENEVPVRISGPQMNNRHILSISCGEDWAGIVVSRSSK